MTPEVRALFPVTERAIYLNHAAVSPPPITTIRAIETQLGDVHENGSINFQNWLASKNGRASYWQISLEHGPNKSRSCATLPMGCRPLPTGLSGARATT